LLNKFLGLMVLNGLKPIIISRLSRTLTRWKLSYFGTGVIVLPVLCPVRPFGFSTDSAYLGPTYVGH